jgi:hypothetical protein
MMATNVTKLDATVHKTNDWLRELTDLGRFSGRGACSRLECGPAVRRTGRVRICEARIQEHPDRSAAVLAA